MKWIFISRYNEMIYKIKMSNIPSYFEYLNEKYYSFKGSSTGNKSIQFIISSVIENKHFFIQFIPSSDTRDEFTDDQLKKIIQTELFDKMPKGIKEIFSQYNGKADMIGPVFTLDSNELLNYIRTFLK